MTSGPGRGPWGVRDFALYHAAFTISQVGSNMVPVALSFAMFARGGGAGMVSLVLAAETLPMVLLLLLGGVVADRLPRRLVMMSADGLRCGSQGLLAVLLLTGHAPLGVVMALVAVLGVGNAFYVPGRTGMVAELLPDALRQSGNALVMQSYSIGTLIGPVLGGALVAATGPSVAIGLDAGSYLAAAGLMFCIRRRPAAAAEAPDVTTLVALKEGFSELRLRTWLWVIMLQFGLFHMLVMGPVLVLGAVRYAHVPHGAVLWGWLLSMLGMGAMLGGVVATKLRPKFPMRMAQLVWLSWFGPPACLALAVPFWWRCAAFFVAGIGTSVFSILWETELQRAIPPARLSRVSAYDMFAALCLLPLGYVLAGPLAGGLGLGGALWAAAGFNTLATVAVLALPAVFWMRSVGISKG